MSEPAKTITLARSGSAKTSLRISHWTQARSTRGSYQSGAAERHSFMASSFPASARRFALPSLLLLLISARSARSEHGVRSNLAMRADATADRVATSASFPSQSGAAAIGRSLQQQQQQADGMRGA